MSFSNSNQFTFIPVHFPLFCNKLRDVLIRSGQTHVARGINDWLYIFQTGKLHATRLDGFTDWVRRQYVQSHVWLEFVLVQKNHVERPPHAVEFTTEGIARPLNP